MTRKELTYNPTVIPQLTLKFWNLLNICVCVNTTHTDGN